MRLATLVLVALLLAAAAARADGDPASDFLYTRETFVPYDLKIDAASKRDLLATVRDANRRHFNIRVAVKPRTYASFLGAELAFVYEPRRQAVEEPGG